MTLKGDFSTRKVWLNGVELLPDESQKVYNHSPDGFSWGYGGSGPAQLALAVMLVFNEKRRALEIYQDFKRKVIAVLPQTDFDVNIIDETWKILNKENI